MLHIGYSKQLSFLSVYIKVLCSCKEDLHKSLAHVENASLAKHSKF